MLLLFPSPLAVTHCGTRLRPNALLRLAVDLFSRCQNDWRRVKAAPTLPTSRLGPASQRGRGSVAGEKVAEHVGVADSERGKKKKNTASRQTHYISLWLSSVAEQSRSF